MSAHTEEVEHVAELVDRARISMFTTMTDSGKHVNRPMAVQEVEFDGDLWFFCYDDSPKAHQIRMNPEVNVSFANDKQSEWTSLSGRAEKMMMKLIVDAASRKVVGAHILGHDAGEMAQILGITLKAGCTKDDFDRTMALHPTAAEELVTMYAPSYRIRDGQRV